MFVGPFGHSIVQRAKEKGLIDIAFLNIRDFGFGKHQTVDDTPYGGGIGMVLRVDILHKAIEQAKASVDQTATQKVILMSASGTLFKQRTARGFAKLDHLIIICGHYEGVDERIMQYVDEEISIGDFVLTGGEIPAMLITDAVSRLVTGVITEGATDDESFSIGGDQQFLEYPHYTKPQVYEKNAVPEILLSGDHKKIAAWREEKSREKTKKMRPDLLSE